MYKSVLILVIAVALASAYEPYKKSEYDDKKEATSYQNYNLKNGKPVYVKVPYAVKDDYKKGEYKPEYKKDEYKKWEYKPHYKKDEYKPHY